MKGRKYFSISVDSTPDVGHKDLSTGIVCYVFDSGPKKAILKISTLNVTQS